MEKNAENVSDCNQVGSTLQKKKSQRKIYGRLSISIQSTARCKDKKKRFEEIATWFAIRCILRY